MKKFYLFTKTLLVAALLCVGASNAWGQVIAFSQDFTDQGSTAPTDYGLVAGPNNGGTNTVTVADGKFSSVVGGSKGNAKNGYTDYYATFDPIGEGNIVKVSYDWMAGNATGKSGTSRSETKLTDASGNVIYVLALYGQDYQWKLNGTNVGTSTKDKLNPSSGTAHTVVATVNMTTKKIQSLTVDGASLATNVDFQSGDATTASRFYIAQSIGANIAWTNTSTIDNISVSYYLDGDYYLKNKETGAYFAVGCSWGTQAMTNETGHRLGFAIQEGGKYHLNTYIYHDEKPSESRHYLKDDFCDGAAQEWEVSPDGEGYYTLHNGTGYLTAGSVGEKITINAAGTGDPIKWQILTAAQRKAEMEARMASATSASGVDATFYITAPEFGYADLDDRAAWQGSPTFGGWDNKSSGRYWNAEKFTESYATFDVYQALTGLKPGAYKLTVQGFYRNGENNESDANDNLAKLYANSVSVPLKNINFYQYENTDHSGEGFTTEKSGYYVPDSQADAAKAFNAGYYDNELYVVVGEDGALRLGVKKDAATGPNKDWACFDNFQLTYYGTSVTASIGAYGYATFSSPYPLDFTSVSDATAWVATACDGSTVTMEQVEGSIYQGKGLVLKSNSGSSAEVTIPVVASSTNYYDDNKLVACLEETTVTPSGDGTNYVLSVQDKKVVFAPVTSADADDNPTVGAGHAYLYVPSGGGARAISMVFGDEILTGINEAAAATEVAQKEGKFIIDGKLVIFKKGMKFNANGARIY